MYRPLLKNAWRIVWKDTALWVFGIFATVVSTGGVIETGQQAFHRVTAGRDLAEELFDGSVPAYDSIIGYIRLFALMEPWRQQAILAVATLVFLLLLVFGVRSQALLLRRAGAKKPPSLRALLRGSEHVFWRLLAIDVSAKALGIALLMAATLPLILFVNVPTLRNGILYVTGFLIFFPAIIVLNMLSILSVISVVERDRQALDAIEESLRLFKRHWIIMLELGLATFLVSVAIMAVSLVAVAALFVGTMRVIGSEAAMASSGFYLTGAAVGVFLLFGVFAVSNGLQTAFQYTVWLLYFRKADSPLGIRSKLERWWGDQRSR
jgi:hypothetical protein